MKTGLPLIILCLIATGFFGCKKDTHQAQLIFKFVFDSTQVRLNGQGQAEPMKAGDAGQCPIMNSMSAHYIELAQGDSTQLGSGAVLYQTATTTAGGASAIEFSAETLTPNNGIFYQTAIKNVTPGTYKWLRVSLAYQNYSVNMQIDTTYSGYTYSGQMPCTVASFIGVNTYITSYTVKTEGFNVSSNRAQGYWGFESKDTLSFSGITYPINILDSGQAPAGATTVVNPLAATSPIPAGSCVATGQFVTTSGTGSPITITGNETSDIVITVSVSTNKSFEWVDVYPNGLWEPLKGENIVDMGVRGIIPYVAQ